MRLSSLFATFRQLFSWLKAAPRLDAPEWKPPTQKDIERYCDGVSETYHTGTIGGRDVFVIFEQWRDKRGSTIKCAVSVVEQVVYEAGGFHIAEPDGEVIFRKEGPYSQIKAEHKAWCELARKGR